MARAPSLKLDPFSVRQAADLGSRIRVARQRRRLRLEDVAQKTGLSRSTVEAVERGALTTAFGAYLSVLTVLALPTLTGKPVIVLSALKPLSVHGEYADDANEKRRGVARLYPGAKQVWVDSGHKIPTEKPEAVTEAVKEMLAAVKHPK